MDIEIKKKINIFIFFIFEQQKFNSKFHFFFKLSEYNLIGLFYFLISLWMLIIIKAYKENYFYLCMFISCYDIEVMMCINNDNFFVYIRD